MIFSLIFSLLATAGVGLTAVYLVERYQAAQAESAEPDASPDDVVDDTPDPDDGMDHGTDDGMDHGTDDGMDHGTDDGMDHGTDDGMDHGTDDGMDHGTDDGMDHGTDDGMDHGTDHEPIPLPQTPEEIEAFIQAVITAEETHVHDMESGKAGEHMAALDLVPRDEATHIAIGNGDWFDPANWYNGEIPGDGAKVLIPEGVHLVYDEVDEARLFTVRVDGELEFAHDASSKMMVDTMVVTPSGKLTIGTIDNPVNPDVDVDIIFANNGPIDVDWDPMLLSRGLIAHGETEIHGAIKDSHEKVIDDPMAGETWVDFAELPEGWQVGDTIVIAGTHYDGYKWDNEIKDVRLYPAEDEVRVITAIEDGRVHFEDPLVFDHDAPREDLKTSVANYTRNVSFETENAETAEIYERGHVMFMHSDDVDVRYAEFHELGRTDKSEMALGVDEFDTIEFDTNIKARYSFHLHKTGVEGEEPAMVVGNAVYGSPGWGFVHHDSYAVLDNNASYDTFGAGYVAETGNETGSWTNNIAIYAEGMSWGEPKWGGNDTDNFDLGKTGDGFWFQGRMVESSDNIAVSVNTGFVYFHRDGSSDGMIDFDADLSGIGEAFYYDESVSADDVPILTFSSNEVFAAREGLHVVKANQNQEQDIHSVFDGFTAWSVKSGAHFEYTSHYIIADFDLIGKDPAPYSNSISGISFGKNTADMTIISPRISGFETGIDLFKEFTNEEFSPELHSYSVIDGSITDVGQIYENYIPTLDTIVSAADLSSYTPDIQIEGPLYYKETDSWETRIVDIEGTKTDGLGETDFPSGTDSYDLRRDDVVRILENDGYFSTGDGQNYFLLDLYFSDRLTGDIYVETHPVLLDENVPVGNQYFHFSGAAFNGVRELDATDGQSSDVASLWAVLTDGQIIHTEEHVLGLADEPEEDPLLEAAL